ncbi:MAG: hypothetical protein AAFV45_09280 [Pseudomonadota bacterium]
MAERLSVTFLTAIWGERYVKEFASVSLPSYLAPDNLDLLARETDFEVVILTTQDSLSFFDKQPAFRRLKSISPVRFLLIDDLVAPGNYGVTLTLAYARGIRDKGDAQTSTYFVFMNSDFVMAKGSCQALLEEMRAGRGAIMAPTLRASAEKILPTLLETVDEQTHTLSIAPRELVQLTFENLHPTVMAKTVTQSLLTCITHNQVYWQVSNDTLLARHHLIFMLAIKPEQPMGPSLSYCDYGFVPDLVPSGDIKVLDNSDAFYLLELQPGAQEGEFLISGTKSPAAIAQELSGWTTKEHRTYAQTTVRFHSGNPPSNLAAKTKQFDIYMKDLQGRMSKTPVPHEHHHYWVPGVQAWLQLRNAGMSLSQQLENGLPPELPQTGDSNPLHSHIQASQAPAKQSPLRVLITESISQRVHTNYNQFVGYIKRSQGAFPDVPIWHGSWADARLFSQWIGRHSNGSGLLVNLAADPLTITFIDGLTQKRQMPLLPVKPSEISELSRAKLRQQFPEPFKTVLIYTRRAHCRDLAQLVGVLVDQVKPDGKVSIYIDHKDGEINPTNFKFELAQYAAEILPPNWIGYDVQAKFIGGRVKGQLARIEQRLRRKVLPLNLYKLPLILFASAGWVSSSCLIACNNMRLRNPSSTCPNACTSAVVTLQRLNN